MKLTADAVIAREKVASYLLQPRPENDKSQFLALVGYMQSHADRLTEDIRTQLLSLDATFEDRTEYGDKYRVSGALTGPNGKVLWVESIWMIEAVSGLTKFVTLYPAKGD